MGFNFYARNPYNFSKIKVAQINPYNINYLPVEVPLKSVKSFRRD